MRKPYYSFLLALSMTILPLAGCHSAETDHLSDISTDQKRTDEHQEITWDLIQMADHNKELKDLLEKAIRQAHALNPDPDTNPVSDLASYYSFIDRCALSMPWEISPSETYDSLYERIDQGMGCLYFICDQPLEELKDKEYFHNSLMYHEPFRSWFIRFLSVSGTYLSTPDSWNDSYYQTALANPDFHLKDGIYEDPSNWKSFNDFFARKLKDASVRPIDSPDDNTVVISPADSVPQGVWKIDDQGKVIAETPEEIAGLSIKTGTLSDVSVLLGNSSYADAFANGTLTHTFLDINDYHRYHFPISGTVREVLLVPQDDAPGGVITWDPVQKRYKEYFSETIGWQSIETRAIVIIETESGGLAAVVPVGMCQVSSVNFEESVVPGAVVRKGDPLGYFLFGGSDIIMIFSEDLDFSLTAEAGTHLEMGNAYGSIR